MGNLTDALKPPVVPTPTPSEVAVVEAGERLLEKRGRKPNSERHDTQIQEAEGKFARKLPEIADNMLDMAMGRVIPRCPIHRQKYTCPDVDCNNNAPGVPENWTAMKYIMDRIAGSPTPKNQEVIQTNFVQKVAMAIAKLFNEVNAIQDESDRARQFAVGLSGLLAVVTTED